MWTQVWGRALIRSGATVTGNLYEELRPILIPADRSANTNVSPSDEVDTVIHTHLHGDHVGWNVRYTGGMPAPNFRRARYLVPKLDWEHFTKPEVLEAHPSIKTQVMPLQRLRKMDLIEGEHSVTGEVTTLPTPGHTPGHQAVLISSQGEKAMIAGDVLHTKAQVYEPAWTAGVDVDKEMSRQTEPVRICWTWRKTKDTWWPPGTSIQMKTSAR